MQPNLGENGLDWPCYLADDFLTAPMIFFHTFRIFLVWFPKIPQTRNARAFLPLNISTLGSVRIYVFCTFLLRNPNPWIALSYAIEFLGVVTGYPVLCTYRDSLKRFVFWGFRVLKIPPYFFAIRYNSENLTCRS